MSTSKEVRTFTETTGSGANKETKVTVETTITHPDGSKTVTKEVTITKGEVAGGADDKKQDGGGLGDQMGKIRLEDNDEFIDEALKAHNEKRTLHSVDPLKHSKDLSKYAQEWAEEIASSGKFQHRSQEPDKERLGENISFSFDSRNPNGYSGTQVTDQWYSEISKYDFQGDYQPGTGHFTQVVWKGSKEFGIGKALSADGKCYIVANYKPAGNLMESFRENVFPLRK